MSKSGKSTEYLTFLCNLKRTANFVGFGLQLHVLNYQNGHLVYIEAIQPGSPAERAGLKVDDIIIEANGINTITSPPVMTRTAITGAPYSLSLLIKRRRSGERSSVYKAGSTRKPSNTFERRTDEKLKLLHLEKLDAKDYGFDIRQRIWKEGKLETFVTHVDQWSPADSSGLKVGDKIVRINDLNMAKCPQDVIRSMVSQTGSLSVLVEEAENKPSNVLFSLRNLDWVQEPSGTPSVKPDNGQLY
ncbi:hypothetical protein ScPMuIL_003268 [Solemya velum]